MCTSVGSPTFIVQTVFTFFPQFTNSQLSCPKFLFIITSYIDNDVFYVHEIVFQQIGSYIIF